MKRLEFLVLLASPALLLIPKQKEKGVGIFIDDKLIAKVEPYMVTIRGEDLYRAITHKPYRMTSKNIKVSDELIEVLK